MVEIIRRRPLFLISVLLVVFGYPTQAQTTDVEIYQVAEVLLISDVAYANPIADVDVRVALSGPNGESREIAAFWDGDRDYRFRFAPSSVGKWTYCTSASDVSNRGLDRACGDINASDYLGENIFERKGWPRVSENNRYFTYADGDPVFLLFEAAMEITWKSTLEEVERYVEDRREKGFNAIWIVPMSHQYFYPNGVTNRAGQPYFLENDVTRLNPRYFDYLDQIVEKMNSAGIIVLLNPIWGRMASVYENSVHQQSISLDTALLHARYIGARYAAHNVMWLIAGDARYDSEEEKFYWNTFADELDRASGGNHLMSAHATGFRGSHYYFSDSGWLDFHTYTPSHFVEADYNWRGAIEASLTVPLKPVVNIEYNFEDLYDKFWLFFSDTTGAVRITSADVRMGAYQGILSGAFAGTSYGANGIWQWATPSTMNGFGVRYTATEALNLEGSSHMGVLKNVMEDLDWYSFTWFDGLITSSSSARKIVAASNGETIVAYLPRNSSIVTLSTIGLSSSLSVEWIDPTSGIKKPEVVYQSSAPNSITVIPPDSNDWLLVVQNLNKWLSINDPSRAIRPLEVIVKPNPFRSSTHFLIQAGEPGSAMLSIYDLLGRRVDFQTKRSDGGFLDYVFSGKASGLYLYRIQFRGESGERYSTGTIIRYK